MGTLVVLGAISGGLNKPRIFYVGLAGIVVIYFVAVLPLGPFFIRLGSARLDKRLNSFADSRTARAVNAWLVLVAVNFAYREGRPKRWYHYVSNMWGKFT